MTANYVFIIRSLAEIVETKSNYTSFIIMAIITLVIIKLRIKTIVYKRIGSFILGNSE